MKFSSRVSVKCSDVRTTINEQRFEAMDFNGSSDRNAACVLGTVSDRDAFEKIYHI